MEGIPKKKKVPGKKQVITKRENGAQKNAKGSRANKKEYPTPKNINPPTYETNKKPVLAPVLNSRKSVKAGPKKMEANPKRGKVPKVKKLPRANLNKTGSSKIQTRTHLTIEIIPESQEDEKNAEVVTPNKALRGTRELATVILPKNEEDEKDCEMKIEPPKSLVDENNIVTQRGACVSESGKYSKSRNDKSKKESHNSHKSKSKTGNEFIKNKKMQFSRLMDRKYLTRKTDILGDKSRKPISNVLGESHEAKSLERKNQFQRSYKTDLIHKSAKESGRNQNQLKLLSKDNQNSDNKVLLGGTGGITHVNSIREMKQYKHFNPVEMSDEEHQNEDHKEKIEDNWNKTENIYSGKNVDSNPSYCEDALVDAFKLAMNDKILLTLLRDQLDASSSDDSTAAGMSSSSNPGVLIWEVQSSGKIDGKKCRTEETSNPHYEDETRVGDCAQDEFSFKKEILEELMTALDNSSDIPKRASKVNEHVRNVKDQETTEEQRKSRVSETEDYQTQDNNNCPIENTSSDNCGDNPQDADDLVKSLDESKNKTSVYAAGMDSFFIDAVNEVFKERENAFEDGNDKIKAEEVIPATSSGVEGYQPLLKFPTISTSAVNNQHEDENEKVYLLKLKSDIESTPSGGILSISKYFVDILSLNKYLRYFNRNQFFKE